MEHLSNFGYAMLGKQANPHTAVTPSVALPLYSETVTTNPNMDEDDRIAGHKLARHSVIMGQRTHMGDITFLAEPNSAAAVADMLLTKGTTSGSDPYTHPFTLSGEKNPAAYTLDIAKGEMVYRYIGVGARNLSIGFDTNKGVFTAGVSALAVFSAANITGVASNKLTLDSTYNQTPTKGLVVDDVVRITRANGDKVDTTVTAVDSATVVTVASATSVASGDVLTLRKQTVADTSMQPVLWAKTQYHFSDTIANALSAAHTPIEADSGNWNIIHAFANDGGEMRSGSFDPASLARTTGDVEMTVRQFFDSVEDERNFMQKQDRAVVVRHFVGTGYEIRLSMDKVAISEKSQPLETGGIIYTEKTLKPQMDTDTGQGFKLDVINDLSTI